MWIYHQKTGKIFQDDQLKGAGYAGNTHGKNNPACENEANCGPLPCGLYEIGAPHDHPRKGPLVMSLTPDAKNYMHGRGGFYIHGDSIRNPGTASEGCIILSHDLRALIAHSDDKELLVVQG